MTSRLGWLPFILAGLGLLLLTGCGGTNPPAPPSNPGAHEWTWEGGSDGLDQSGFYGTKGVADPTNAPGARVGMCAWTDASGNFWLFGGHGSTGDLNDLWKYSNGEWTWVSGSDGTEQAGVYGTKGMPAPGNVPGARFDLTCWIDASGNLWLLGGLGIDSAGRRGDLDDLWEYDPTTGMWTWMSGPETLSDIGGNFANAGVYGTRGVPALDNMPGSRVSAASWTDSSGDLWLFGGFGWDSLGNLDDLNDLWKYNPATNLWVWVSGSNAGSPLGVYGTIGVASPANIPGGRTSGVTWKDTSGNFWLLGGEGQDLNGVHCQQTAGPCYLNDLWKYDPAANMWTWMGGSDLVDQSGTYGAEGTPAPGNFPGARWFAVAWTDPAGNFWLFGGNGFDSSSRPQVFGDLNDLWEYNPATNIWTWISGSNRVEQKGVYGARGVPAPGNVPGAREFGAGWTDSSGNLWLFGGFDLFGIGSSKFNDLWKYEP